ncbi:MAG: hypothetical protein IJ493_03095 [Clostridia bacterium]|nr:hypothetical protein [Clostridia bacterium]
MKKLAILLLALTMTLAACGGEPVQSGSDTPSAGADGTTASGTLSDDTAADTTAKPSGDDKTAALAAYECKLDSGVTITIGGVSADVLAPLGDHIDYMEAPSCVRDGTDKVYTYDGFTVTSSPRADGSECISEMSLTSDAVAFENGLTIGVSGDDVTAALGEDFTEQFGVRKYAVDGVTISVILDGDAVTGVSVALDTY